MAPMFRFNMLLNYRLNIDTILIVLKISISLFLSISHLLQRHQLQRPSACYHKESHEGAFHFADGNVLNKDVGLLHIHIGLFRAFDN